MWYAVAPATSVHASVMLPLPAVAVTPVGTAGKTAVVSGGIAGAEGGVGGAGAGGAGGGVGGVAGSVVPPVLVGAGFGTSSGMLTVGAGAGIALVTLLTATSGAALDATLGASAAGA